MKELRYTKLLTHILNLGLWCLSSDTLNTRPPVAKTFDELIRPFMWLSVSPPFNYVTNEINHPGLNICRRWNFIDFCGNFCGTNLGKV
jgi:hypothetical protein